MMGSRALVLSLLLLFLPADQSNVRDERIQGQMGTVHGTIRFLNHPELGNTPAAAAYVLFQRSDCRKAVVGVTSDADGQYRIALFSGRYRVFSRYGTQAGETTDWLAPDQERFVNLRAGDYKEFNLNFKFPE